MRLLSIVAAAALFGCSSATDDGGPAANVRGTWTYSATQSGSATLLEGGLVIDEQNGAAFTGQFNGQLRDDAGVITNADGIASGRAFGADAIDFDLIVNGVERRHVGRIAGNSVSGTWAQQNGTASISGAFVLTRP